MSGDPVPELVVYRRSGCPCSSRLRRVLNRHGIAHTEIDIWDDEEAAAFVRSVADGNETVPTVVLRTAGAEDRHWVNPKPRLVVSAVKAEAPELAGGPRKLWSF